MRTASKINEIAKSTKETMTELAGTIIRGKYTFEIKFAFVTSELLPSAREVANNCHGSIAAKTITGYGTPSLGSLAILPKMKTKTTMVRNGRSTAQRTPITVCL